MRSSAVPRLRNKTTTALVRNTIRKETRRTLLKGSHNPFPYQLDAAVAVATGRDTVLIAPTGAGKTLILAMPLLYHKTKVSIVISPLQALETDQALKMNQLGIKSNSVDLPKEDVQVCDCILCTAKSFHLHGSVIVVVTVALRIVRIVLLVRYLHIRGHKILQESKNVG